jgi:hypothetical protein
MAKGPKITEEIMGQIARIYLAHRDWPAKKIQHEIHAQLRKKNPQIPPDWPGLSSVQKILAPIRTKDAEMRSGSKGIDRPWSVVTLAEYEIPPEALPTVLKMAVHFRQREEEGEGRRMTIREARWAARLSSMEDLHKLFQTIQEYAEEEKVVELTGIRDEFTFGIDDGLYMALTDKSSKEPVFDDKTGMELESSALIKIRKGLEQRRRIKPVSKKKQRGGKT